MKYRINLSKAKILLILCLCFIGGIACRSFLPIPFYFGYAIILVAVVILIILWQKKVVRLISFCLIFLILGVLRYEISLPRPAPESINYYNESTVAFFGVISAEPDWRQDHTKLTVKVVQGIKGVPDKLTGKVLMKTLLFPEYNYGDLLEISCRLQAPQGFAYETAEGSRFFAYDKYLARFDIYSVCYQPQIKLAAHNKGNLFLGDLLKAKGHFIQSLQQALAEPQASFLGGLILGAKRSIPEDLMTAFNRTGTTHVVALSGYNITIIAVLIFNLCKFFWLNRKKSFWVSITAITFFILITGASASAVRAGVMGALVLLAQQVGRKSRITNALVLVAVIMLLMNPKVLVFDTGFQLSFLATLGLIYLSPILEIVFQKLPSFFSLKENLSATLSAIIMTTPLTLWQFGRFSVVAPLVNLLILPLIPLAMGVGFLTGLLAVIWLPIGQIAGWLAWLVLSYIILVVENFAKLPVASISFGALSGWWLAGAYITIVIAVFIYNKYFFRKTAFAYANKK